MQNFVLSFSVAFFHYFDGHRFPERYSRDLLLVILQDIHIFGTKMGNAATSKKGDSAENGNLSKSKPI